MNSNEQDSRTRTLYRGAYVWSGIAMTIGGYLGEEFVGAEHAFEAFMFFGGLNLGIGITKNLYERKAQESAGALEVETPS
ncbi:MAG: hypothetical protein ACI9K5_002794 [Gammaproteobacteria bacterium]|jgi:hypothetical protein